MTVCEHNTHTHISAHIHEACVNEPTNQHPINFSASTLLVGHHEKHPACKD